MFEIEKIIRKSSRGKTPCPMVRDIIQERVKESRMQLNELTALQKRMEKAMARWATMPDGIPDGNTICELIEAVAEE